MTARKSAAQNAAKPVKKGGRPRIELDESVLKALASIGATEEEIVAGLIANGCKLDLRTLKRRLQEQHYRDIWLLGRATFKQGLRRLQFQHARMPNSAGVTMTIHMSKHQLGETEKAAIELSGHVDSTIEVSSARDRVNTQLDSIAKRIAGGVAGGVAAARTKRAAGGSV